MSFEQVKITWVLMLIQGGRRLYESLASIQFDFNEVGTESRMWVGHWVVGLLFYFGVSVGVWVEGIRKHYARLLPLRYGN